MLNYDEYDMKSLHDTYALKIARQKLELDHNKAILVQLYSKIKDLKSDVELLNSEIIDMELERDELRRKIDKLYELKSMDKDSIILTKKYKAPSQPNISSKYDFIFEYPLDEHGKYILPKEFVTPALRKWCSLKGIKYTTTDRKVYDFIFDYEQDENGRYILPKEVVTPTLSNYCSRKGIRYTTKNN